VGRGGQKLQLGCFRLELGNLDQYLVESHHIDMICTIHEVCACKQGIQTKLATAYSILSC
jgi:hypothetical protein